MNISEIKQLDAEHHLHPFTDFHDLNKTGTRVITQAEGVYIWDQDGQKLLDGMSGLWCCNLGYSRSEIVDAVAEQLHKLPYYNNFFQCTHESATAAANLLTSVAPAHMNNVFFTNSGSESNDTVIRLIHRYWDLMEQPQRKQIISRENAYHGSTIAGASLGGMSFMHEQFTGLNYVHFAKQPYWFKEGGELNPEEFGLLAAKSVEDKILQVGPENVAAFIGEPIQGAGGVIIPPSSYWPEVKRICDHYGILLVVDEVIFGFGRTGQWFGSDYYDLKPDLIPFAKGVTNGYQPLGGVFVGDKIANVIKAKGGEFGHGFTYSGHPAATAAAIATVNILRNENMVEQVAKRAPYFNQRWMELGQHPLVGEARCLGYVGALELVKDKSSRQRFDDKSTAGGVCRDICVQNGLVMRATGDNMIVAPPFICDKAEIDELVEKAHKCLDLAYKELTK
jgi:putrescine aminotransferase